MTTRERTYARANQQRAAQYAEIWIIAQPAEIAAMVQVASASGRLVYLGPPQQMGGDDTRHRRYLRLRTT
ncbi:MULTISPECIES: hypothetical protein [Micromonospora]|uniref:Uncharacterized protein n=1 Tax=Micromonospora solifontis TaxID=2487138 RepID=A0ABX9WPY8_9ACTN|nr:MULTISPECIES: hypothetical protein [Micromonospora]NES13272.1 hypothetical protein [Micromonospora sp. PPF5-17B]NES34641.1 hypothetical protein [Micromonospora solifontis]NES56995.1 hypothetical protein [Micromonospora sp. PPF5-6]RNM01884.1 hypothetical protein EFE23_00450 [Micromonospora solifontis]